MVMWFYGTILKLILYSFIVHKNNNVNIIQNISYCSTQKKESQMGLELHEDDFILG